MSHGIFPAPFAAFLGLALVLLPIETAARSAGMASGRAFSPPPPRLSSPVARPAIPPPALTARVAQPVIGTSPVHRSGHWIVRNTAPVLRPHPIPGSLHTARPFLRHVRPLRFGLPVVWWGGPAVYSYDPDAEVVPSEEPQVIYPTDSFDPGPEGYPLPRRQDCYSQEYKVPAERGGERTINVIRCGFAARLIPAAPPSK